MPKTKGNRTPEVPPIVDIMESTLLSSFEEYRSNRRKWDLHRRCKELLWSYPFGLEPKLSEQSDRYTSDWRSVLQEAEKSEKEFGDRHLEDRAKLQREARLHCRSENVPFEPICAIGEEYRDQWWMHLVKISVRDEIRVRILPLLHAQKQWPDALAKRRKAVNTYLRPLTDDAAQEYCALINRLTALEPQIQPRLTMKQIFPWDGHYRVSKAGRPRPPASATRQHLRRLKVPPVDIDRLLKAWSLSSLE